MMLQRMFLSTQIVCTVSQKKLPITLCNRLKLCQILTDVSQLIHCSKEYINDQEQVRGQKEAMKWVHVPPSLSEKFWLTNRPAIGN